MSDTAAKGAMLPLIATLYAFSAGPVGVAVQKHLVETFDPPAIIAVQMTVGAAVLWLVRPFLPKRPLPLVAYAKGIALGIVHPGAFMIVFTAASARLDSITVVLLLALGPAVVAFLGRLVLKEALKATVVVGLVVSFVGLVLLVSERQASGENQVSGFLLAMLGLAFVGAGVVTGRAMNTGAVLPWYVLAPLQVSGAAILSWIGVLALGDPVRIDLVVRNWAAFAYLALGMTAAGYFAYNFALSRFPTTTIGLLASAGPGVGAIAAALIFDQRLSAPAILAIAVILFGAALPALHGVVADRYGRPPKTLGEPEP